MGGRLIVCELCEVFCRGVTKPANRAEHNNNPNEKFSKTESTSIRSFSHFLFNRVFFFPGHCRADPRTLQTLDI